ncbi:hypothetical protein, partial [Mycobacterium tuberculosis]
CVGEGCQFETFQCQLSGLLCNASISNCLLQEAVKLIQPSSRREGFSAIPNVKWEDVGGLDVLRHELDRHIVKRIKDPDLYAVSNIS